MAASASTEDKWRRRWRRDDGDLDDDDDDELLVGEEEDEIVPSCHSDTDTDEYYNRHSPTEYDDEADSCCKGATSAVIPVNNGSPSSVARGRWGGTGKRARSGLGTGTRAMSVSPSADRERDQSMTPIVTAAAPKPVLQPVPVPFVPPRILPASSVPARTNLSGQSSIAQSVHNDAVDTVVERAGAASASRPSPCDEAAIHHQQPLAPPPTAAGRQNPDGYTCPKCGMWFATHQGLGGHSVGHKHRERELTRAVPGGGRDDAKRRERVHVCSDCGAEFATGVQLGGHKRKHWTGAPIVPKKKPRAVVAVLDQPLPPPAGSAARVVSLTMAVKANEAPPLAAAPPAVEPEPALETTLQLAARTPMAGRLRLFGVDIEPAVKTPEVRQGSPVSATGSLGWDQPAASRSHSQ